MNPIRPERDEMIRAAVMRRPDDVVNESVCLWENLAHELVSIIGDRGFKMLFQRSLHLASATFPWMKTQCSLRQNAPMFADFEQCLSSQKQGDAGDASAALLIIFIDILALLIGEPLTSSILRSAWGDEILDTVVKEIP